MLFESEMIFPLGSSRVGTIEVIHQLLAVRMESVQDIRVGLSVFQASFFALKSVHTSSLISKSAFL